MANDDILSQEEIEALLRGDTPGGSENSEGDIPSEAIQSEENPVNENTTEEVNTQDANTCGTEDLSEMERDALGEIGNISMGTAATTLSTLLGKKVSITTPNVTVTTADEVAKANRLPLVAIDVSWRVGLEGSNIMLMQSNDIKIIADLMMGKTEGFDLERELTEIDLSAGSEAMNQMMGSASTSLSEMFDKKVDISPPTAVEITLEDSKDSLEIFKKPECLVSIQFRMVVEDLLDTSFVQLFPLSFGKEMVKMLMGANMDQPTAETATPNEVTSQTNPQAQPGQDVAQPQYQASPVQEIPPVQYQMPPQQYQTPPQQYYSPPYQQPQVAVSQPQFQSFDSIGGGHGRVESIDLVGDIPVELSVELGRTNKKIGEILEFNEGTVIELNKLVGESLEIFANNKLIAKGEVVVIDDNFGVRVTEIELHNKELI